jgi:hypothetical protein
MSNEVKGMERVINMVIRQFVNQVVNRGMNAGIDKLTQGRADATPEQQARARESGNRTKQAMRLIRRFARF